MNDMIRKIISMSEKDLLKRKSVQSIEDMEAKIQNLPKSLDFYSAFNNFGIIAEIKLASPSAGNLANSEDVLEIASDYKEGGADAISIITEEYFFKGDIKFIKLVKEKSNLPILQKDFVVDPYQIYESRIAGADALLLIAKIISPDQLIKFTDLCFKIGIEPVVEINDDLDLENALNTKTRIIAVNARDLDNFKVDVERACELVRKIPGDYLKLGFSGVNSKDEVEEYRNAGVSGVLVGTKLMKSGNKQSFLSSLRSESKKEFLEELR